MGTSVRKTSEKIKKLLKKAKTEQPDVSLNDVVPAIVETTLKAKKTKAYFGDKDFASFAGGGVGAFKKAASGGYDNFVQSYGIDPKEVGQIEREKIIAAILDEVEASSGEIESELLLSAFRSAVIEMLIEKNVDPKQFLVRFCELFIVMIVREEASESLNDEFSGLTYEDTKKPIEKFAKEYVQSNFLTAISEYVAGRIEIADLISKMQSVL